MTSACRRSSSGVFPAAGRGRTVTLTIDEIQFIQSGRGLWTVNGEEFEAGAGDIDEPLVQLDVHLATRFIQENLG